MGARPMIQALLVVLWFWGYEAWAKRERRLLKERYDNAFRAAVDACVSRDFS